MPVADYAEYRRMLETAYNNKYAYPAINVCNIESVNAALEGFAQAKSDGIIQVSTGAGEHASGLAVKSSVLGAISLAEHIHFMAEQYKVYIALHTDHCKADKVETFLRPLIAETGKRRAKGGKNLFSSHMFDGSELPLAENMKVSKELLCLCAENEIVLEVETGVVGGERSQQRGRSQGKALYNARRHDRGI